MTIMGSARRRIISTVVVAVLLSVLGGVGQAQANEPWWKVHTFSATSDAAGEAEIMVETTNLGDATANKTFSPVTVVDKLPPGVTATAIYGEGGGTSLGTILQKFFSSCSLATLTCTYELPVMAYERVMTAIIVKVAPGAGEGENEVSVSGGLAPPVVSRHALALEGPSRPYGVESYELTPEEGGARDTQAGSHPFQLTTSFTMNTHTVVATGVRGTRLEAQPPALTKDLRFDLPAGLIGNPTPLPQCSTYVFTLSGNTSGGENTPCPTDTVVGVATTTLNAVGSGEHAPFVGTVPLYNLVPAPVSPRDSVSWWTKVPGDPRHLGPHGRRLRRCRQCSKHSSGCRAPRQRGDILGRADRSPARYYTWVHAWKKRSQIHLHRTGRSVSCE